MFLRNYKKSVLRKNSAKKSKNILVKKTLKNCVEKICVKKLKKNLGQKIKKNLC